MATFLVPIPPVWQANMSDDTAEAVAEHLASQGLPAEVSVQTDPPMLRIDAASDPTPLLGGYLGGASTNRNRLQQAKTLAQTYRDKVVDGQPVTALESSRALAATITLLEHLYRD